MKNLSVQTHVRELGKLHTRPAVAEAMAAILFTFSDCLTSFTAIKVINLVNIYNMNIYYSFW